MHEGDSLGHADECSEGSRTSRSRNFQDAFTDGREKLRMEIPEDRRGVGVLVRVASVFEDAGANQTRNQYFVAGSVKRAHAISGAAENMEARKREERKEKGGKGRVAVLGATGQAAINLLGGR